MGAEGGKGGGRGGAGERFQIYIEIPFMNRVNRNKKCQHFANFYSKIAPSFAETEVKISVNFLPREKKKNRTRENFQYSAREIKKIPEKKTAKFNPRKKKASREKNA